jgi:hypothetical protein
MLASLPAGLVIPEVGHAGSWRLQTARNNGLFRSYLLAIFALYATR